MSPQQRGRQRQGRRANVAAVRVIDQKPAVSENSTVDPAIVLPFLVEEKFGCR